MTSNADPMSRILCLLAFGGLKFPILCLLALGGLKNLRATNATAINLKCLRCQDLLGAAVLFGLEHHRNFLEYVNCQAQQVLRVIANRLRDIAMVVSEGG